MTDGLKDCRKCTALVEALKANLATMQEQQSRMIRWGKSHSELSAAINETAATLTVRAG